jgi:methylphosphotriester-DNA--protein-cysteine methyltransferase
MQGIKKRTALWRVARWLALAFLLSFLVTLGKLWLQRTQADQAVRDEVAKIAAIDPGWQFEDIEKQWKKLADDDNRAIVVRKIAKEVPKDWPIWDQSEELKYDNDGNQVVSERARIKSEFDELGIGESLSPTAMELLNEELTRVKPVLEKAGELVKYADGSLNFVYLIIWPATIVGDLQASRNVCFLLRYQSWQQSQKGDGDSACQSCRGMLSAGTSIGDWNTMIGHLVRVATVSETVSTTERALALAQAKPETLRRLQEEFDKESELQPELFLRSARLERALTHRMMQSLWDGEITLAQMRDYRYEPDSAWDQFSLLFGLSPLRIEHAAYLRESTEEIEKWKIPWEPKEVPTEKGISIHGVMGKSWYKMYVDGMAKYKTALPRIQASLRSAILALAAERYRLDKGAWPNSLEDLVPRYVKGIPQDPYGKGPMRMARKKNSVVFYSVWQDGEDDGGNLDRDFSRRKGTDFGFQLWDAARRKGQ